jgi:hypothetical protein
MKTLFRFLFVSSILITSWMMNSCEVDDTTDTNPDDPRNKFVGVWQFKELKSLKNGANQSYVVTISLDPSNSSQVILDNFGNPGSSDQSVEGTATINSIIVSSQILQNGWVIESGNGKLTSDANVMNWSYTIMIGGDSQDYVATAEKQVFSALK